MVAMVVLAAAVVASFVWTFVMWRRDRRRMQRLTAAERRLVDMGQAWDREWEWPSRPGRDAA
jgi:hypothetical protein